MLVFWALVRKEILALSRDSHALAALFVMPALFIVIMSLALKDMYAPPSKPLLYSVEVQEQSPLARRFVTNWEKAHGKALLVPAAQQQEQLRLGQLAYVIVLKPGLSAALVNIDPPEKALVNFISEPALNPQMRRALQAELAGAVGELRATAMLATLMGSSANPSITTFISNSVLGTEAALPSAVQHNVPAWLVFGMFFVVTAMSSLFIQEQSDRTLARLFGMGVSTQTLLLSKAFPYLAINAIQAAVMLSVGVWLMPILGAEGLALAGIHWGALALMLFSLSVAAIGFALLLACVARTFAQANTLGPLCNILMAALGGIMVPTFVMPPFMQRVASFSPLNWGLEGLHTVFLRHGDITATGPWVLRLFAFGLVCAALASFLFSRRVSS